MATFATLLIQEGEKQAEEKKAAADNSDGARDPKEKAARKAGIVSTDTSCKPS